MKRETRKKKMNTSKSSQVIINGSFSPFLGMNNMNKVINYPTDYNI